jgi:magnesium transporter
VSIAIPKAQPDDPIVKHMHQDFPRLRVGQNVGEALEFLRQQPPRGKIVYFYVLDSQGRLQGVVPARQLILNAADTPLADLMIRHVIMLPARATVLEACEFFIQHRLLAYPVVDEERMLLGIIDVELYTDELEKLGTAEARDDIFQLIGVHVAEAHQDSALLAFRMRFPWLGCNLIAGILAAILSGVYEKELQGVVALAFFIPVVLNLAESVSSQSVSLALQALRGTWPRWKPIMAKTRKEFATGLLLGLASSSVVALVCLAWLGNVRVALCLIGGITGGVIGGAILGLIMPVALRLVRLEPRVAAGPIALAGADVITILLYLNLARWLVS